MKYKNYLKEVLSFALLVAALILPVAISNPAMADAHIKVNVHSFTNQKEAAVCEEEDYSVSAIKIFNWI